MGWMDVIERLKRATGLTDKQVAAMEKRGTLRVYKRVSLVGLRENDENVNLLAVDLAAKGMRVEVPIRLKKDEIVTLYKTMLTQRTKHRANIDVDDDAPRARVVWCKKRRDAMNHEAGLAFIIDTPEQRRGVAHFLLEDCQVGIRDPREHRKAPRVASPMKALVQTSDGSTFDATANDIAVGGVLLCLDRALDRNTAIDVKVFLPDTPQALLCKGTVVRSTQVEAKKWELGVSFTEVADDHRERLVGALSKMLQAAAPAM